MSYSKELLKIPVDGASELSYTLWSPDRGHDHETLLVVLVNGLMTNMSSWHPVAEKLCESAISKKLLQSPYILAYDRWSCGESDPLPPRTCYDIAACSNDVWALIKNVCSRHELVLQATSLILVGSSIGCCMIRLLAGFNEVKEKACRITGVLLLDSYISNTDFTSLFPPERKSESPALSNTRQVITKLFHPSVKNPEGLDRRTAAQLLPSASLPKLAEDVKLCLVVAAHDPEYNAKEMEEKLGIDGSCFLQYVDAAWQRYNEGLASLSPSGSLLVVDKASHFIHRDRPDFVVGQILYMTQSYIDGLAKN